MTLEETTPKYEYTPDARYAVLYGSIQTYIDLETDSMYKWRNDQLGYVSYVDAEGTTWYLVLDETANPIGWTSQVEITTIDASTFYNSIY